VKNNLWSKHFKNWSGQNWLPTTIALGDVEEFEILPPGTAAWFCNKDKFKLPMFSDVCQAETKAQ
jgi:hypothetical protein